MALPTFVSVGALSASVGAITPTMAASVLAGDILLFPLHTNSGEAITVSGGTETWAEVTDSPQDGTNFRLTLFWARASQDAPTSPTTSDSGNHNIGAIAAFRGCIATGNPWDVTSAGVDNVSDTALSITGDTTTVADCLVVQLVGLGTSKTVSGEANTDLANLTERFEASSGAGNGGSLAVYTGEKASAGAFGATTATISTGSRKAFITVALKPVSGGGISVGFIPI